MASVIAQVLADVTARPALQQLNYDRASARQLLTDLDTFLRAYVTGDGVGGTEPRSKVEDKKALADIATTWLDEQGRGRSYWPREDPSKYRGHLCYDNKNHYLITDCVQELVCALNRVRNVEQYELNPVRKRYTIIAKATLHSLRKHEELRLPLGLSDDKLCRTLSLQLNTTNSVIDTSIESISDRFEVQLQQDRVVGLPPIFLPLAHYDDVEKQDEAATVGLQYLNDVGMISRIGRNIEERLQTAARACGQLCFKHGFALPADLLDSTLPDLLKKLAIMELALRKQ